MTAYWTITVIAVVAAALIAWLLASGRLKSKLAGSESTIENLKAELAKTENELRLERARADEVGQARATLEAELTHVRESLSEDQKRLEELKQSFKVLSGDALKTSNEQFLTLAGQNFAKHVESISGLLKPMRDTLSQMEKDRVGAASQQQAGNAEIVAGADLRYRAAQARHPGISPGIGEVVGIYVLDIGKGLRGAKTAVAGAGAGGKPARLEAPARPPVVQGVIGAGKPDAAFYRARRVMRTIG